MLDRNVWDDVEDGPHSERPSLGDERLGLLQRHHVSSVSREPVAISNGFTSQDALSVTELMSGSFRIIGIRLPRS